MAFIRLAAKVVTTDCISTTVVSLTASELTPSPKVAAGSHEFSETRDLVPEHFIRALALTRNRNRVCDCGNTHIHIAF